MTFAATRRFTSSPEAVSGPLQLDLLAGLTTGPSGPAPVPASPSRPPARGSEPMIQGICGRTFFASLEALEPQGSDPLSLWESRLAERLATIGSTESALIWRKKVSPAGHVIFRLAPSTLHTNGTASIGSQYEPSARPTATVPSGGRTMTFDEAVTQRKRKDGGKAQLNLENAMLHLAPASARDGNGTLHLPALIYGAQASPRVTPSARDWKDSPGMATEAGDRNRIDQLPRQMAQERQASASAQAWPRATPQSRDSKGSRTPNGSQEIRPGGQMLNEQIVETADMQVSPWATPRVEAGRALGDPKHITGKRGAGNIEDQMQALAWPTPTSLSFKESHQPGNSRSMNKMLALAEGTALTGPTPNGSSATTEKRGAPNPVFAFWLMGFPDEWTSGALAAMRSFRRRRPKSSQRSKKRSTVEG